MAVLIDLQVPGATVDQAYAMEALTQARGEAVGGPPYTGCVFLAASHDGDGLRLVGAWRTEPEFHAVLDTMMRPDFESLGLSVSGVRVTPVLSMAVPGAHAP